MSIFPTGGILSMSSINPQSVTLNFGQNVGTAIPATGLSNAIKQDLNVSSALAGDEILLKALESPENFITSRKLLIEQFAEVASRASADIVSLIVRGALSGDGGEIAGIVPIPLGNEVANDIARKVGIALLSASIQQIDGIFDNVKGRVLDKITSTRVPVQMP